MNNDAGVAWYEDNHDQFVEIEMRCNGYRREGACLSPNDDF